MDAQDRLSHLLTPSGKGAFSLVELSIVLVILGLLTGGILSGQHLIRGAELRKFVTKQDRYRIAIRQFQDKYLGLPSDVTHATRFWNRKVNSGACASQSGAPVGVPGTCDGNGDGKIEWTNLGNTESHRMFEQLAFAGLVEGNLYHCIATCPTGQVNNPHPQVGIGEARAMVGYIGAGMHNTSMHGNAEMNILRFGAPSSFASGFPAGIASPDEAYSIDTKMDDGLPGRGKLLIHYDGSNPEVVANRCVSIYNSPATVYNFQYSMRTCHFNFVLD